MSNLERPPGTVMSSWVAGQAEGGRSSRGGQVQLWRPKGPKRCRLCLLSSCLGGFIFMIFFPFVFFFLAFSFFPPVCMCLCVLSFRLGWESAGCSCFALTFHRKRGLGPAVQPTRMKEQGVGRNRSYPRYQDCA